MKRRGFYKSLKNFIRNEKDDLDLEDWSEKYDVTIDVLKQEYAQYIDSIRSVDEKANKYLLIVSIFIAGMFTVLSSSFINKLQFNFFPLDLPSLLTIIFLLLLIIGGVYGWMVVKALLDSLEFVETRRMPDMKIKLEEYGETNSTQYKHVIICCYQEAINVIEDSIATKQAKMRSISGNMRRFIILVMMSITVLFVIATLGAEPIMTTKNPIPPTAQPTTPQRIARTDNTKSDHTYNKLGLKVANESLNEGSINKTRVVFDSVNNIKKDEK